MNRQVRVKIVIASLLWGISEIVAADTQIATFENVPVGVKAYDMTNSNFVPMNYTLAVDASSGAPVFDGARAVQMSIDKGSFGSGTWGANVNYPSLLGEGSEAWLRVATYFPANFMWAQVKLKFLRFHTPSGYVDTYILNNGQFSYDNEVAGTSTQAKPIGQPVQKGKWETYEQYVKFSSVPGQGVYRLWQNGKLVYEDKTLRTLPNSSATSDMALIFTYWNQAAPQTQSMYIDDIVWTSTRPSCVDDHGNYMIGPAKSTAPACIVGAQ